MKAPALGLAGLLVVSGPGASCAASDAAKQGEYLFRAALCGICHTAEGGRFLAGGRPIGTPFGIFYSPNITPDRVFGIGAWSEKDFIRALREGVSPQGEHYYPAFPYTAYTRMTTEDILAIKAYLDNVEPVAEPSRPHDLAWYASWRWPLGIWKSLYFQPGQMAPDPGKDASWNRGGYLVEALGHCAECHTRRDFLGALDRDALYAGAPEGAEGKETPNITPDKAKGIGSWSERMLAFYLETGMTPDGDFAGGLMAKVIDQGTSQLRSEDRRAIARYIRALPPKSPQE